MIIGSKIVLAVFFMLVLLHECITMVMAPLLSRRISKLSNFNTDVALWEYELWGPCSRGHKQHGQVKTNSVYPETAKVKVAQLSVKSGHAVRWSLQLFSSCQSLLLISAHLEDVLTYFGWSPTGPFDYEQPVLIVMIKRGSDPSVPFSRPSSLAPCQTFCGCLWR